MFSFNDLEQARYQRQLQLPSFGPAGQGRVRQAHVAIVGMGGLGCPVSLYLAAAGVGKLSLIDADEVSLSNLQRQILFTEDDIGSNKASVAARHLRVRNSDIHIVAHPCKLTPDNAASLLAEVDMVIDCSDNFYARYLINDTCFKANIPWIYSSALGQQGQVALLQPQHSCFRCLFPKLNSVPDCNQAGVLGVMPGMLGTMQASLALQYLAEVDLPAGNELHLVTSWPFSLRTIQLSRAPHCLLCEGHGSANDFALDYHSKERSLDERYVVSPSQFKALAANPATVLIDVRDELEHQQGNLGGINLPLANIEAMFVPQADTQYLFYCKTGKRSALALQRLLNHYADTTIDWQWYSLTNIALD